MIDLLGQVTNDIGIGVGIGGLGSGSIIYWLLRRELKKVLDHVENDTIHIRPNTCQEAQKMIDAKLNTEHLEHREDVAKIHARIDETTKAYQEALLDIVRTQQEGNRAIVEAILNKR